MINVSFELQKTEQAKKKFSQLASRIKDLRPVFKEFVKYYQDDIVPAAFSTRGALMGKKWEALTPAYRSWKSKQGGTGAADLKLSLDLYNAATGGSGWYDKIGKKSLEFGIKDGVIPYANRHQQGTNGMPQRPYFYTVNNNLPTKAWRHLLDRMESYLEVE